MTAAPRLPVHINDVDGFADLVTAAAASAIAQARAEGNWYRAALTIGSLAFLLAEGMRAVEPHGRAVPGPAPVRH